MEDFKATFIKVIPKMDDLEIFEDFRTISLHNTIYKVIAEVERISVGGNRKKAIWFSKWKENSQRPQNHTRGSPSCHSEEKTYIHSQIHLYFQN